MFKFIFLIGILLLGSCSESTESVRNSEKKEKLSPVDIYYNANYQDSIRSKSIGSVSNGKIENATLIRFSGNNYHYFDSASYLTGRAFTHQSVAKILENSFKEIEESGNKRIFQIMELSNQYGGKMFPHRTHQNGLSVDLMTPLNKKGKPCYDLDHLGALHYLLDFDKSGKYEDDPSIIIDFDQVAEEILILEKQARLQGMKIGKLIFNTDLRDELLSSKNGLKLKSSGIYITRNLQKTINDLHDDHFHVDFQFL